VILPEQARPFGDDLPEAPPAPRHNDRPEEAELLRAGRSSPSVLDSAGRAASSNWDGVEDRLQAEPEFLRGVGSRILASYCPHVHRWFELLLARQDTGCKLSAPKTNTPLNALFCGVFRLNLLTSPTPQMSYLRS
jgi:hypothetical protein